MSTIPLNSPQYDFFSPLHFSVSFQRLDPLPFMVTRAVLPNLILNNPKVETPFNPILQPGDKVHFGSLSLTFKVDAMLQNWLALYNWMNGIGFPSSFAQRANVETTKKVASLRSDISVLVLDYHKQPIVSIDFQDAFPIELTGLELDTTVQDVQYAEATGVFEFRQFTIKQINTDTQNPPIQ